jgi:hypothetical protein
MRTEEVESLWNFGEPEPWRRGRLVLVIFAATTFVFQVLVLGSYILMGNIEQVLLQGIAALLFWLQFYFIWIGVHWVRWLQGFSSALWGFALVIWGVRDGLVLTIGLGLYSFGFGVYVGFAPAVYFFAKRQQETRRWSEALIATAVFVMLLISLASGTFGLSVYRAQRETYARHFADVALKRIFTQHDTYFFLDHVSENLLRENSRLGLTEFLQDATIRAGDVHDIQPSGGRLQFWYGFPLKLVGFGVMRAEGSGMRGRVEMQLKIIEVGSDWQIDQISWFYPELLRRSSNHRD